MMTPRQLSSLAAAVVWTLPFVLGKNLRIGDFQRRRLGVSVAAGVSIAYVFVGLMPEMNEMQRVFSAAEGIQGLPFPDFRVHSAALLGFVSFYALENMVAFTEGKKATQDARRWSATAAHIGGFALYCGLTAFLLYDKSSAGGRQQILYDVAMFFHFWVVDHSLREEHGELYDRRGRWVIASSVLGGCILGMLGLYSDIWVPTCAGFIGGGVVINSIKDELPKRGEGRVLPFFLGACAFTALLLLGG